MHRHAEKLIFVILLISTSYAYALEYNQAALNLFFISAGQFDAEACEKFTPGAREKYDRWFPTVERIYKESIRTLDKEAEGKGLGEDDRRTFIQMALGTIKNKVRGIRDYNVKICMRLDSSLNFYKSQLQE